MPPLKEKINVGILLGFALPCIQNNSYAYVICFKFGWLVELLHSEAELKFCLVEYGDQYVVMAGIYEMLRLFVASWDTMELKRRLIVTW